MYGRTVKTFDETTIIHMYKRQLMGAIIMDNANTGSYCYSGPTLMYT